MNLKSSKKIMRYEFFEIKSKKPQKLIYRVLDENQKRFAFSYNENKYHSSLRDRKGVETFPTYYHSAHIKNHELIKDIEERRHKI